MGAAALLGGGIMGGGLIGTAGQLWANNQQLNFARDQQNWEQFMSGTAHQREVADLKAAGLNPMLAVMNKGASTPSAIATPDLKNPGGPMAQAVGQAAQGIAIDAARVSNETRIADAHSAKLEAERQNVNADTILKGQEAGRSDYTTQLLMQKITSEILGQAATTVGMGETTARTSQLGEQTRLTKQEADALGALVPFLKQGGAAVNQLITALTKGGPLGDAAASIIERLKHDATASPNTTDLWNLIKSAWQKMTSPIPHPQMTPPSATMKSH